MIFAVCLGVINAVYAIAFHRQQKARAHLWFWCTRIEQGRCCVCKPTLTHQMVGFDNAVDVVLAIRN